MRQQLIREQPTTAEQNRLSCFWEKNTTTTSGTESPLLLLGEDDNDYQEQNCLASVRRNPNN
jgi:hypothetical protein